MEMVLKIGRKSAEFIKNILVGYATFCQTFKTWLGVKYA